MVLFVRTIEFIDNVRKILQEIGDNYEELDMNNNEQSNTINDERLYVVEHDIPLHMLRDQPDTASGEIPFMHFQFSDKVPGSLVSYPHRHSFYEVLYVTGGNGTHFIDFHAHPIEPNTFYFITPRQVHYWETAGQAIEGEIFLFTEDFLLLAPADFMVLHELSFFHNADENSALHLNQTEHESTAPLIDAISSEYQTLIYRSESVLRAYLHILLVQIQRICAEQTRRTKNSQDTAAQRLVRRFRQLVTHHFQEEQAVSFYADRLGITVTHLINNVKSVTGQTPGRIIRQETVIEAKRLFAYTDMTAAEVGLRLGFDDPSYFSRFFQRETGVNTVGFRRSLLDKYQIEK